MPFIQIGGTHLNTDQIITIYDDGTAMSVDMVNAERHQFFNEGADALRRWLTANGEELELRDDDEPLYEPGEEVIVNGVPHYVVRYHGGERITVVPAQHVLWIHVGLVSGIGDDDEDDDPQPAPVETPRFKVGDTVAHCIGDKWYSGKIIGADGAYWSVLLHNPPEGVDPLNVFDEYEIRLDDIPF